MNNCYKFFFAYQFMKVYENYPNYNYHLELSPFDLPVCSCRYNILVKGLRYPVFQEHDSVMLGEMSPHHEYCDIKLSSETPPSYNQLNYNEKLERFFDSKPSLTTIYDNSKEKTNFTVLYNDENVKSNWSQTPPNHNIQNPDDSGCGSNENSSIGSNNQTNSTSRDDITDCNCNLSALDNFQSVTLTESLLNKHNQEMEKLVVQKHKERRTGIKNSKLNEEMMITLNGQKEATNEDQVIQHQQQRGCKRRNSCNEEEKFIKKTKYDGMEEKNDRTKCSLTTGNNTINENSLTEKSRPSIDICPQISVTSSFQLSIRDITQNSILPHTSPIYDMPVTKSRENAIDEAASQWNLNQFSDVSSSAQSTSHVPFVAAPSSNAMHPFIIDASASSSSSSSSSSSPSPIIYATSMILDVSTIQNQRIKKLEMAGQPNAIDDVKRRASQLAGIKAEPGSNKAMSATSKKDIFSAGYFSSCASVDYGCFSLAGMPSPVEDTTQSCEIESSLEDSSDSSFYGGFLNTSSESSCNPDQIFESKKKEKYISRCHEAVESERGPFSMVNELRANFELQQQTIRQAKAKAQNIIPRETKNLMIKQQPLQVHNMHYTPPWLQDVKMTPEIVYRYQMSPKTLTEVLEADRDHLKYLHQPPLVNDQLDQLYLDLKLDGFGTKLILDDNHRCSDDGDVSADANSSRISPQHERIVKLQWHYKKDVPLPSSV